MNPSIINNKKIPKTSELLKRIDWKELCNLAHPVIFHGDGLQPEKVNHLYKKKTILFNRLERGFWWPKNCRRSVL